MLEAQSAPILWQPEPERAATTRLHEFWRQARSISGRELADYAALQRWSTEFPEDFWLLVARFCDLRFDQPASRVVDDVRRMPGARWFLDGRLNFASNLLRRRDSDTAIIAVIEDQPPRQLSFAELHRAAAGFATWLRSQGVGKGDVVAAWMPNVPETVIGLLGAAAVGAIWTSCSPDFGVQGVIDRFGQVRPRVLIAARKYRFKGATIDCRDRLASIVGALPELKALVIADRDEPSMEVQRAGLSVAAFSEACASPALADSEFVSLSFDDPLYIMYSSGTTGLPKCMVQGVGVLLNHLKEHQLHCDLRAGDRIFYFTTCGWMMWNWLVSALASEASLVLYDGNPLHPDPGVLWRLAADHRLNIFGTSARYIAALQDLEYRPRQIGDFPDLRALLSTGSPLAPESFDYIYENVKRDVQLSSISGGTDLNGCFALGNPLLPVRRGELQCIGLGMKVEIWNEAGQPVVGEQGELVCTQAFPSMPLYFWDDANGELYRRAYFDRYPGVWRHGDFAELSAAGGLRVAGRSDATLNPGGVRIGTADIYRVVEALPEVADSVCIGQAWQNDVRVVLFVQLREGVELDAALKDKIRAELRQRLSPRHVPAVILQTPAIPYTRNMKKVEIAVRQAVIGRQPGNLDALLNPEALQHFQNRPELQ